MSLKRAYVRRIRSGAARLPTAPDYEATHLKAKCCSPEMSFVIITAARGPDIKSRRTERWPYFGIQRQHTRARKKKRNRNRRRGENVLTSLFLIVMTGKGFRVNSSATSCGPWQLIRPAATAGNELEKWQKCRAGELCPWNLDGSFNYSPD